jgi:hypothetical protein
VHFINSETIGQKFQGKFGQESLLLGLFEAGMTCKNLKSVSKSQDVA